MIPALRIFRFLLLPAWLFGLAAVGWLLLALDTGALAVPGLSVDAWDLWFTDTAAVDMLIALLRVVSLVGVAYLLAALGLAIVAAATHVRALERFAESFSLPIVRRVVANSIGLATAASLAVPAMAQAATPTDWPVLHHVDPNTVPDTANSGTAIPDAIKATTTIPTAVAPTTPTVLPKTTTTAAPTVSVPASAAPATADPATADPIASDVREHIVRPGENLWLIAASALREDHRTEASDRDISEYLRHLIDANKTVLVDPANPDLIFTGQTLRLPPA